MVYVKRESDMGRERGVLLRKTSHAGIQEPQAVLPNPITSNIMGWNQPAFGRTLCQSPLSCPCARLGSKDSHVNPRTVVVRLCVNVFAGLNMLRVTEGKRTEAKVMKPRYARGRCFPSSRNPKSGRQGSNTETVASLLCKGTSHWLIMGLDGDTVPRRPLFTGLPGRNRFVGIEYGSTSRRVPGTGVRCVSWLKVL